MDRVFITSPLAWFRLLSRIGGGNRSLLHPHSDQEELQASYAYSGNWSPGTSRWPWTTSRRFINGSSSSTSTFTFGA